MRTGTPSSARSPRSAARQRPGRRVRGADVSLHLSSRAPRATAVHTDQHPDPHLWSSPSGQGFAMGLCWRRALEHLL